MFKIQITGKGELTRLAARLETAPQRTYQKVCERADEMYSEIKKTMPVLTGNLQKSVVIERKQGEKEVTIRLPMVGVYSNHEDYRTTQYFPKWHTGRLHSSESHHTRAEVLRTKEMGLRVRANPNVVRGKNKDVFRNALEAQGFRNIKRTRRGYRATPPENWPFTGGSGRLR
jgi:hypothetical protein